MRFDDNDGLVAGAARDGKGIIPLPAVTDNGYESHLVGAFTLDMLSDCAKEDEPKLPNAIEAAAIDPGSTKPISECNTSFT